MLIEVTKELILVKSSFAQGHVPKVGQVVVNCDGSIKDNDSYSSCGGLVTDHFGSLW